MKKLTLVKARVIAGVCCLLLTSVLAVVCFVPKRAVSIVGGESYSPIYKGNEEKPCVALMFNVYENTETVNAILDVLLGFDVKATFFVGGCWADDNNDTVKRILNEGHGLGNHGYFHKNHKKLGLNDNIAEIKHNHELIKAISGCEMTLFAPPSGAFSKNTLIAAEKLGYKTIMWSKDTIDWRDNDVNLVYKRATEIQNGDFILLHPKAHTLKALSQILDFYKEKGVTPKRVDELI